ncbi:hypothetical protein PR048_006636 [Dryococelus australis]|uniref:Uncharacterized protein n=1 Tax=Dryococelus australis TaxID=614101 RepID=A0ABQ9IBJ0_9NEOP|nr:hypothetical protein PR048_006636 [Dryococelus australis]
MGLLQPIEPPLLLQLWALDVKGPLQTSCKGNLYILFMTELFSQFVVVKPIRLPSANSTWLEAMQPSQVLVNQYSQRHRKLCEILMENREHAKINFLQSQRNQK